MNLPNSFIAPVGEVQNQENIGACVPCCIASILEALNGKKYSTLWIYGYREENYPEGIGYDIAPALRTITKIGLLEKDQCPDLVEWPEASEIINEKLDEYIQLASQNKISSYDRIYGEEEIKEYIYTNNTPIIGSICVEDRNTINLDKNYVAIIPSTGFEWHTIVIYGWNENGFLAQNTWGKDWGNNGCFIIPYNYEIIETWGLKI